MPSKKKESMRKSKSTSTTSNPPMKKHKEAVRRSTSASTASTLNSDDDSTYDDVTMGSLRGSLKLSDEHLCFEADDGSRKIKLSWDQMSRHMISPANSPNTLLRIVSKKNNSKILKLPSRGSLLQIRRDISHRLRSGNSGGAAPNKRTSAPALSHSSLPMEMPQLRKTQSQEIVRSKKIVSEDDEKEQKDLMGSVSEPGRSTRKKAGTGSSSSKIKPDYNWRKHRLHHSLNDLNLDAFAPLKVNLKKSVVDEMIEEEDANEVEKETSPSSKKKNKKDKKKSKEGKSDKRDRLHHSLNDLGMDASNESNESMEKGTSPSSKRKNKRDKKHKKKSKEDKSKKSDRLHQSLNDLDLDAFAPLQANLQKSRVVDEMMEEEDANDVEKETSLSSKNKSKKDKKISKEGKSDKKDREEKKKSDEKKEQGEAKSDDVSELAPYNPNDVSKNGEKKSDPNDNEPVQSREEVEAANTISKEEEAAATAPQSTLDDHNNVKSEEEEKKSDDSEDEVEASNADSIGETTTKEEQEVSTNSEQETTPPTNREEDGHVEEERKADETKHVDSAAGAPGTSNTYDEYNVEERVSFVLNGADDDETKAEERVSFDLKGEGAKRTIMRALASSLTSLSGEEPTPTDDDDESKVEERTSLDSKGEDAKRQIIKALGNSLSSSLTSLSDEGGSSAKLRNSLGNSSLNGSFNMNEDEIERQIMKSLGKNFVPTPVGEGSEMDAKAARKSRMSVRMSTRVAAMNNMNSSRRASRNMMGTRASTRMSISNGRMSTRMSVSRRGSGAFVMLKDLEERDEFQKVQAGAFLRELYKMADAQTKQQLKETILTRDVSSASASKGGAKDEGSITFDGMDLSALTPEQAKTAYDALHAGGKIDGDSLIALIQAGVEMLSEEETVIDLRELHPTLNKVTAVGDLHGSLECLMVVLKLVDIDNIGDGSVVVFDGDFVDRGHNSLEVIATLLLLKLSRPRNVFLLRGNHEDSMTASSYGFREEVDEKYGYDKGDEIWWEFGMLFAAFPIVARSNTAAIMHGGIPVEEFNLSDLNELPKETRCEMKTISDPYDDDERLLQGILWSDPSEEEGINFSDRGAGFTFGPDISKDFLDRHDLKYIIRAHEVVETGHCQHDVGEGRGVVTIFSSANYPAGEGTNHGAVLFLDDQTGDYDTKDFIHKEDNESQETDVFHGFLGAFVDGHKSHLTKAFREKQNDEGLVTCEQWADVIAELLDLPEISLTWLDMQPELAPTTEPDGEYIDWTAFLNKYTTVPTAKVLAKDDLAALSENQDKFLDIFQVIDTSMSGTISKEEFISGVKLLNQQITDDKQKIEDAEQLFDAFDVDNDGELTIEEFSKALQESTALQGVTEALKEDQVGQLKQNQDMIATSFKYLDTDKNGCIDRTEFKKGFEALNERMPERNKFGNHEDWFDMFELNDAEQIDFNAFKQVFCAI